MIVLEIHLMLIKIKVNEKFTKREKKMVLPIKSTINPTQHFILMG